MPRHPAKTSAPLPDSVLSRRILVNIVRDQTTATPRVVWAHEVPILEAIFTTVRQVDADTLDEGYSDRPSAELQPFNKTTTKPPRPSESLGLGYVFLGNPESEYERLAAAYGPEPDTGRPWVEHIYGRFSTGTFERILGRPTVEDLPEAQLREQIMLHGFTLPQVSYEASEADRKAAQAAWLKWQTMTRAELHAMAKEFDVQVG